MTTNPTMTAKKVVPIDARRDCADLDSRSNKNGELDRISERKRRSVAVPTRNEEVAMTRHDITNSKK